MKGIPNKWRNRAIVGCGGAVMVCICLAIMVARTPSSPDATIAPTTALDTAVAVQASTTGAIESTSATTATPVNTATLELSATPRGTNTPRPPTSTPLPTNTVTPVPTPVVIEGTGDSIVDAENPFDVGVVHISGNAASRYFGVTNYAEGNVMLDGLVNTTDPYDGYRPLDFRDGERTVRFEVQATGPWIIEILPLAAAHSFEIPGSYSGNGDDVVIMMGGKPDTATITGNAASRYFGVISYGSDGRIDSLVNTTDVYAGTVLMSSNAVVLEVQSEGEWTIDVK